MSGLTRIEIPLTPDGGVFTARARPEGNLGPLVDDQNGTFTGITGTNAGDVIDTISEHYLRVGDTFILRDLAGGTGLDEETVYYVLTTPTPHTLTLSATSGGAQKTFSSDITDGTLVVQSRQAVIRQMLAALTDTLYGDVTQGPILITTPGVGYRAL